jgi:hypothetical protein
MAVVCRAYDDEEEAHRAVSALLDAGIPGEGVRVLMGEPPRDAREEPEGEFEGETDPGDVVGDFAGPGHLRDEGEGTFAGSAAEQREGSFADADRETVTSYPGGVEREHVADHHDLRRLLLDAGLDKATADRDVEGLHEGRVLVLADLGERSDDDVARAFGDQN